jgi:P-loop ATPase protein family
MNHFHFSSRIETRIEKTVFSLIAPQGCGLSIVLKPFEQAGLSTALVTLSKSGFLPKTLLPKADVLGIRLPVGYPSEGLNKLGSFLSEVAGKEASRWVALTDLPESLWHRLHPKDRGDDYETLITWLETYRQECFKKAPYQLEAQGYSLSALSQKCWTLAQPLFPELRQTPEPSLLRIELLSFGFKRGLPPTADWVMDARFLPNPFYEPTLRPLTGRDEPIQAYLNQYAETKGFLTHTEALLQSLWPVYQQQGKAFIQVAIGCTGGKHRSVMMVETLAQRFQIMLDPNLFEVYATHRDRRFW